jgi:hypothetical protein
MVACIAASRARAKAGDGELGSVERLLAERTQENEALKTELAKANRIVVSVFSPLLSPESIDPPSLDRRRTSVSMMITSRLLRSCNPIR